MTATIMNDINKMLRLYRECDEEYVKLIEIMNTQYLRSTLESNYWTERQQKDILRHFQDVVDRRCKLRLDIQEYYMRKIRAGGKGRSILPAKLMTAMEKMKLRKSSTSTSTSTSTLDISSTSTTVMTRRKTLSKFARFLGNTTKCFICYT